MLSRREFIHKSFWGGLRLGAAGMALSTPLSLIGQLREAAAQESAFDKIIEQAPIAKYWISTEFESTGCLSCHDPQDIGDRQQYDHGQVIIKCELCAQACMIPEGRRGVCRTRINHRGQLKSLVYGRPVSIHVDPIEKKPFYHFRPGSSAFSLATAGCPLSCKFCQNWEISQANPESFQSLFVPPGAVVQAAGDRLAPVIAFTYNEPTVFMEYLADIARLARNQGISSVLVSCGFMSEAPLDEMCDVLDAIKIDLKGFSRHFYRTVCNADLQPVLRSIRQIAKRRVHLEIVNLVVPTLNDSADMLNELAKWIAGEVGPNVPVHFTRFHPDYQMLNLPPTPTATLEKAYEIAKSAGIRYPFVGNVPGHEGNHSYCPRCGKAVIIRSGFFVDAMHLKQGRCTYCGDPIAGVFS